MNYNNKGGVIVGKVSLQKVSLQDNFQATKDGESYCFSAQSDRQAWYLAYAWSDGELLDSLCEIDEIGNPVRVLLEEEKSHEI